MPLILAIVVFVTVVRAVFAFGGAAVTPSSLLGARLRALAGQATVPPKKPTTKIKDRIEQALDPLSKAIPLSPSDVSRTRVWLIQAGLREPRHATMYFGSRLVLAFIGFIAVVLFTKGSIFDNLPMLLCAAALGFFIP